MTTPPSTFEDSYRRGEPPWVIDQPQPAVVDLERARERARAAGVEAGFTVADAMDPSALGRFATVLDSALFHVFGADDRARYARALTDVVDPGGRVIVLALSIRGPGFGPQIDDDAVGAAFAAPDWTVEDLAATTYRGRVTHADRATATGSALGELVDLPAVVARIRRAAP